jgi:hypothetical protein
LKGNKARELRNEKMDGNDRAILLLEAEHIVRITDGYIEKQRPDRGDDKDSKEISINMRPAISLSLFTTSY